MDFFDRLPKLRKMDLIFGMWNIYTAKLLVPKPGPFEVEIATAQLKSINRLVAIKFCRTDSSRR
jgi:hypothetical protein